MSRHYVELEELLAAIDQLNVFAGRVESAMSEADAHVNRLHASWSGTAAEEHRAVHARWRHGATQMHEALLAMRHIASTAHGNYTNAAAANTRMWAL